MQVLLFFRVQFCFPFFGILFVLFCLFFFLFEFLHIEIKTTFTYGLLLIFRFHKIQVSVSFVPPHAQKRAPPIQSSKHSGIIAAVRRATRLTDPKHAATTHTVARARAHSHFASDLRRLPSHQCFSSPLLCVQTLHATPSLHSSFQSSIGRSHQDGRRKK